MHLPPDVRVFGTGSSTNNRRMIVAGKRDWNLRQGDIAEQLGILLMQSLTAVAPVPRTEDVGVDIVATLLRQEGNRRLIAEDAFYVQLKSASVTEVRYEDDEIQWLKSLELPFFIGSVDIRANTMRLFASHELLRFRSDPVLQQDVTKLRVFLEAGSPVGFDAPRERRLHFGPPILQWTLSDHTNANVRELHYSILKNHLGLMQTNLLSASAGFHLQLEWQTNEVPTAAMPSQCMAGEPSALFNVLDKSWRFLHAWYFNLRALGKVSEAARLHQLLIDMETIGWVFPKEASMITFMKMMDDSSSNYLFRNSGASVITQSRLHRHPDTPT